MISYYTKNVLACVSLLLGFLFSLSASPVSEIPAWNKCITLNNSEIINIILSGKNKYDTENDCVSNGILHINTKNSNRGNISYIGDRWFKTEPIDDANIDSAMRMFRELEIDLITKIGSPTFFHKQGVNTSRETSLLLMKRGKIEYRTEWNLGKKHLVLLLSGEDLALYIKIFYK